MMEPYPWQQRHWDQLRRRSQCASVPHALLICGPAGMGKLHFARLFAQSLLCTQPTEHGLPCNHCQGCALYRAGSHPDHRDITTEEDSRQIKVGQVRELVEFMGLSRQLARYKVALVRGAERMNRNAANSLLKTLEEPPPWSLILLVSHSPKALPATIRSRCQQLALRTPPREQSETWLRARSGDPNPALLLSLAHGAPLAALELTENDLLAQRQTVFQQLLEVLAGRLSAVGMAEHCQKIEPQRLIAWLCTWLTDIIRLRNRQDAAHLDNPDLHQTLAGLCQRATLQSLFNLYDQLLEFLRVVDTSLNQRLLSEAVLLAWQEAFRP